MVIGIDRFKNFPMCEKIDLVGISLVKFAVNKFHMILTLFEIIQVKIFK